MKAITRRRLIQIGAVLGGAALASKIYTPRFEWSGRALGADAHITLYGDRDHIKITMEQVLRRVAKIESEFSLFDENSSLSKLNDTGQILNPSADMASLIKASKQIHSECFGAFDPCVQSRWLALANNTEIPQPHSIENMTVNDHALSFEKPNMAMTLNGIAQGYLSDEIHGLLSAQGFSETLVNMGEYRAGDGKWQIAVQNQSAQTIAQTNLHQMAMATSSSDALFIGKEQQSHIFTSTRAPKWKTVSVKAKTALIADAFSTALTLMDKKEVVEVFNQRSDVKELWLESFDGSIDNYSLA